MEVMYFVTGVLVIMNIFQGWMNIRLIQGKQTGLPMVAEKMLDLIQENQTQLIAALRDRAKQTPDPRDDQAVEFLSMALSALSSGAAVTPPAETAAS